MHGNQRSELLINVVLSVFTQLLSWDIIKGKKQFNLHKGEAFFGISAFISTIVFHVILLFEIAAMSCELYFTNLSRCLWNGTLQLYLSWLATVMSQNLRHSFYKVWFSPIIPVIRIQVNDFHGVKNNILKRVTDLPFISPNLSSFCNMGVYQNYI